MNMRSFKRFCGITITLISAGIIYVFIRSEAWFGVMIGLFLGAVGIQAVLQPDYIFRAGNKETEVPPIPSYGQQSPTEPNGDQPQQTIPKHATPKHSSHE